MENEKALATETPAAEEKALTKKEKRAAKKAQKEQVAKERKDKKEKAKNEKKYRGPREYKVRNLRYGKGLNTLLGLSVIVFILIFVMLHILWGSKEFLTSLKDAFKPMTDYLFKFKNRADYYITLVMVGVILIVAIVWWIKLMRTKSKGIAYLQPFTFLFGALLVAAIVVNNGKIADNFNAPATQEVTMYFIIFSLVYIGIAINVLVLSLFMPLEVKTEMYESRRDRERREAYEKEQARLDEEERERRERELDDERRAKDEERKEREFQERQQQFRDIIRSEMADYVFLKKDNIYIRAPKEERVIIKEVPVLREEKKEEPAPAPAPEPVKEEPAPAPAPEPEPEPAPAPAPAPVPEKVVEPEVVKEEPKVEEAKPAVVRVPFNERVLSYDDGLKAKYNELKNYILTYDVKSRVSNSADSFRARRQLFVKITTSGNSGFRVYYALDLKDYQDSPIPVKDAGTAKTYEETPLFIRVSSDLSLKRAKQLVDDVMAKYNVERLTDEPDNVDYVAELKNL
jgi:hypothetical protein